MEDESRRTTRPELVPSIETSAENEPGSHNVSDIDHEPQTNFQGTDPEAMNFPQIDSYQMPSSAFDLRSVANVLPDQNYRSYSHAQGHMPYTSSSSYGHGYNYNYQGPQLSGQAPNAYNMQYAQQSLQSSAPQRTFINAQLGTSGVINQMQHMSNPMYYQQQPVSPPHGMMQNNVYGQIPSPLSGNYPPNQSQYSRMGPNFPVPQLRVDNYNATVGGVNSPYSPIEGSTTRHVQSPSSSHPPSALRGPPRKPKQSGHALWVGNLPPGTRIIDLKDHFSHDATDDIESVFLISKSNCAFVNYKTEQSCAAAMTRFHDSRFQGVRLVCRLRRGSSSANPPSPNTVTVRRENDPEAAQPVQEDSKQGVEVEKDSEYQEPSAGAETEKSPAKSVKEKYFVVKSLTLEDLERSVVSGIWATQSHNENALNQAFKVAENVYLIFSANKSGEYFGYARMDQPISAENETENRSRYIESSEMRLNSRPSQPSITTADLPLTIPTPATATAPKGHIIDDSARGTIFWEAETEDIAAAQLDVAVAEAAESEENSGDENSRETDADTTTVAQQSSFGKPFKITWISTESLPFYRTRGLRNPWNANREVKIARDGTELEPSVGKRLIGMFSQQAHLNAAARGLNQQQPQFTMPPQHQYGPIPPGYGYPPQGHNNPYNRPY